MTDMFDRLKADASEGADLSPGDPVAAWAVGEITRLRGWVQDLQSGMYVNCVYCGHRYGPGETAPVSMANALKAHIEQCPQHPMSQLRARITQIRDDWSEEYGIAGLIHDLDETLNPGRPKPDEPESPPPMFKVNP